VELGQTLAPPAPGKDALIRLLQLFLKHNLSLVSLHVVYPEALVAQMDEASLPLDFVRSSESSQHVWNPGPMKEVSAQKRPPLF
jgi:hypothetical protein